MYFWKQEGIEPIEVPPTFSVDADQVLGPYFRKFSLDPKKIAREAFDLLLMTWLTDIAFLEQHQTSQETQPEWLAEFATSLKEAHIEMSDV